MKRLIYSTLFVAALSLFMVSCSEDYLDTLPTDQVAAESAFTTTGNAMQALNGIHRLMYQQHNSNQGQSGEGSVNINRDMLGEDLVMTSSGNGWYNNTYKWVDHRSETSSVDYAPWYLYYRIIANANMIINNIDNAVGPQEEKDAIKGEALIYRAWGHFNLVQLYGKRYVAGTQNTQLGVPIMLTNNFDGQPRNSVEEVYDQINLDLNEAITLHANYSRLNNSHLNIDVARGVKARVALVKQDWANAASLAAQARTSFPLMSNSQYTAGFNDYTNGEWMWGSTVVPDQTTYFYSYFAYMSRNFSSTNIRGNPKAINTLLYNDPIFTATDVRKANFDPTGLHTALALPSSFTRKPYTSQKYIAAGGADSRGDVVYMRAAEMYLIEAEAYARMGGRDTDAQAALNALRQNRETDPANYVPTANTGTALIDEIMLNRRLELWGEGFRFTDLKRLNLPLNRNGANHQVALCTVTDVPAGDVRWTWLIPKQEMDSNEQMVQNDL
ncbi:MAG: RagB/SusD family nutrient uptake outer membrane protein [Bacteroidales bacterium]|nr:RagB/SusD family nutrient uptake outer membrane protein [Bacteroidales bacterium]